MDQSKFPFLTVGIAFYNSEKTLAKAIKSVLMQSYSNFEFILIDDGSADNSYAIAEGFSLVDKRIKLIKGGENKGVGFRLNQITDLAKGEYIVRMDGDDMMLPQKIEMQMKLLTKNKELDLVDCAAYIIDNFDIPVGKRKVNNIDNLDLRKVLKARTVFFHPTVIAKTSWYKKHMYNVDFRRGPDFELWCRTISNTNYARIDEPMFLYREGRVSIKNYKLNCESYRKSLKIHYRNNLSFIELQKEIALSYVKYYLYLFFGFFNIQHLLTATRNSKITLSEKEKIHNSIKEISDLNLKPTFGTAESFPKVLSICIAVTSIM